MAKCNKDITPLQTHWSYIFLAQTHRNVRQITLSLTKTKQITQILCWYFMGYNAANYLHHACLHTLHKAWLTYIIMITADGLVPTRLRDTAHLTHLPLDKMAAISQTIFSDVFSWMKSLIFWLKFHWSLFIKSHWQKPSSGVDNGLVPKKRQAIIWTYADSIHRRIYGALVNCQ